MNGIECAFTGTVAVLPDQKIAKSGKAWTALLVRIGEGDGAQFTRVACFGDAAETAAKLAKGSSVYVEGRLTLNQWTTQDGADRHGLNVAANLVQALGQIGRRRPKSARADRSAGASDWQRPLDRDAARLDQGMPF